ncbi:MAG: prefoldin subunit beta [archaeon]
MAELPKETQKDIVQLQSLQRQLQILAAQKQQFEISVVQADATLAELEKAEGKAYKAIGSVLIESKPKDIIAELNEKRKEANERIETLKAQEERLAKKAEELQKKVQKELESKTS